MRTSSLALAAAAIAVALLGAPTLASEIDGLRATITIKKPLELYLRNGAKKPVRNGPAQVWIQADSVRICPGEQTRYDECFTFRTDLYRDPTGSQATILRADVSGQKGVRMLVSHGPAQYIGKTRCDDNQPLVYGKLMKTLHTLTLMTEEMDSQRRRAVLAVVNAPEFTQVDCPKMDSPSRYGGAARPLPQY